MTFSLLQILFSIVVYLSMLFAVATMAERRILPRAITGHPAIYVLSLGVFAGATATYGTTDMAQRFGYSFLLYYVGAVLVFVMAALLLVPLLRLCRVYQLSSLADVLTFRFRSSWVGTAITLAMCITLMPLLALQIQAVSDAVHILNGDLEYLVSTGPKQDGLAFLFCVIITVFTLLFGSRRSPGQARNEGLVTAIAFESLVKLLSMLVLMAVAVFVVFDGFDDLERWLREQPAANLLVSRPIGGDSARALLLVFFAGAVAMPHLFHMAMAENTDSRDLRIATWGLPLYLLLLSLPILPVAWAGIRLGHQLPMEYSALALGLELHSTTITATAFVAGLSAASATIIVTTLALANMCLNHLLLPLPILNLDAKQDIYVQLRWLRGAVISLLILGGYLFFQLLSNRQSLTDLALVTFTGTLQFLPGILATFYWPGANRIGLLSGLGLGLGVWATTLLGPAVGGGTQLWLASWVPVWLNALGNDWTAATMVCLLANGLVTIVVSLLTPTSNEEQVAAEICSMDDLNRPTRRTLSVRNASEVIERLVPALGDSTAHSEVARALQELRLENTESRPYALRRLRARIEANLSGLMGPAVAYRIMDRCLPYTESSGADAEDINLIERDLERSQGHFTGLAADLDALRQHYRDVLDSLPVGVCSLGGDGEVLMWNRAMQDTTGVDTPAVVGSRLSALGQPWGPLIEHFARGPQDVILKQQVHLPGGESRWVSMHRASQGDGEGDQLLLVEDISDLELLERELLHNERLASIGRLAAGVAHEVGNPVTGIACLAQNLEFDADSDELRETARDILQQTDRVSRIVESLVNFSHGGSRSGDVRLAPCNVADCIDESINLLRLDTQATEVHYDNRCDRELVVLADSQRLLQVLLNLLTNARAASNNGDVIVIDCASTADQATIWVEDRGSGVDQALHSQIFEPFFTTREPGEGTGLGLALVHSIMEDMHGSVTVSSPLHKTGQPGSRFTLTLPVTDYDLNHSP